MTSLVGRVKKIAEGAALMTETTVAHQVISAVSQLAATAPETKDLATALTEMAAAADPATA